MAVDRRSFTIGLMFALTAACNAGSQGKAVAPTGGWWPFYRQRFLLPEGRIVDTGNHGISHSEGQGYAMVLAANAGDREAFDLMAGWTERTLGRSDMALHSWRYDPASANPVSDPNNATDGDILIAWALGLAARRWGDSRYAARGQAIRAAVRGHCVAQRYGRAVLIPGLVGFDSPQALTINPSYYVWPALDQFLEDDGKAVWGPVIADGAALIRLSRFGPDHLPTDWIDLTARDAVAPARDRPPRFGFDALRVALYAAMANRAALAAPIGAFWRARLAAGKPIPAWIDVVTAEEAPYPLSSGGAAIVARLLGTQAPAQLADDYYSASLQMLAAG
ncbi:glycosyl hydrolase family 8 [Novosphingobium colocasiae]|uniref:glycosyl hydrolase family 8 n=1 Tax=Novosphingobium colocasiae TaxID=1256513 RepID=UPI0035AE40D4